MTVMTGKDPAPPEAFGDEEKTEAQALREEISNLLDRVQEYRAGNTELLGALMLMMADTREGEASSEGMRVLRAAGMADENGALNWPALAARQDNRWTWKEVVCALVKNPAAQARLLALSDDEADAGRS